MMVFVTIIMAFQASMAPPCLGVTARPAGFTWTYSGTRTTEREERAPVTWTTTLLEARSEGRTYLVLVRGFVMDLVGAGPAAESKLSLLACSEGRLTRFTADADEVVRAAFSTWDPSLLERSTLLFKTPLRSGGVFGQDPPRPDLLYGWEVEAVATVSPAPRSCGGGGVGTAYRLTYRTNPDLSIVEWQAGVGVREYLYEHHGTRNTVDVRLVSCGLNRR